MSAHVGARTRYVTRRARHTVGKHLYHLDGELRMTANCVCRQEAARAARERDQRYSKRDGDEGDGAQSPRRPAGSGDSKDGGVGRNSQSAKVKNRQDGKSWMRALYGSSACACVHMPFLSSAVGA